MASGMGEVIHGCVLGVRYKGNVEYKHCSIFSIVILNCRAPVAQ
jgi:hypothetical protein